MDCWLWVIFFIKLNRMLQNELQFPIIEFNFQPSKRSIWQVPNLKKCSKKSKRIQIKSSSIFSSSSSLSLSLSTSTAKKEIGRYPNNIFIVYWMTDPYCLAMIEDFFLFLIFFHEYKSKSYRFLLLSDIYCIDLNQFHCALIFFMSVNILLLIYFYFFFLNLMNEF